MTVGSHDEAVIWHLPKALLIRQSLFFAAALSGSFAEAELNSVTMPEDDPNIFKLWVQWLYVGQFTYVKERVGEIMVKGWILGDKLGCYIFRDVVMVKLLACHSSGLGHDLIDPSTLRAAYEGSAPGSLLRRWALDSFLFETKHKERRDAAALERNRRWYPEAKDIEDFSQDYMEASVCSVEGGPGNNPYYMPSLYMVR